MLHDLFAEWARSAPGFILVYLIAFGFRLGAKTDPWFQVHGLIESIWKLAENVGGVREQIGADFKSVKDSQTEIKVVLARVEEKIDRRPSDDSSISLRLK